MKNITNFILSKIYNNLSLELEQSLNKHMFGIMYIGLTMQSFKHSENIIGAPKMIFFQYCDNS